MVNPLLFLVNMATPISLGYLLQMSLGVASIITLGHLGTRELAACALGNNYGSVNQVTSLQ